MMKDAELTDDIECAVSKRETDARARNDRILRQTPLFDRYFSQCALWFNTDNSYIGMMFPYEVYRSSRASSDVEDTFPPPAS